MWRRLLRAILTGSSCDKSQVAAYVIVPAVRPRSHTECLVEQLAPGAKERRVLSTGVTPQTDQAKLSTTAPTAAIRSTPA